MRCLYVAYEAVLSSLFPASQKTNCEQSGRSHCIASWFWNRLDAEVKITGCGVQAFVAGEAGIVPDVKCLDTVRGAEIESRRRSDCRRTKEV